ncbi:hypothetical protein OAS39_03090 [Pirellulales bacterium]|nr:hypothetical protein [Pirellulales bacterium]
MPPSDGMTFETGRCDDSAASLRAAFASVDKPGSGKTGSGKTGRGKTGGGETGNCGAGSWEGVVRGPVCHHSRTLAADFPIDSDGQVLVTEPCYWTPAMPFLYDVTAIVRTADGLSRRVERTIGLRRLEPRGASLYLEGRRIVLRGTIIPAASGEIPAASGEIPAASGEMPPAGGEIPAASGEIPAASGETATSDPDAIIAAARDEEAAILIRGYDESLCWAAARVGVATITDLRDCGSLAAMGLPSPAEQPAVVAWIVDVEQCSEPFCIPGGTLLAVAVGAKEPPVSLPSASLVAFEFSERAQPPQWLANSEKPAIAIRTYSESPPIQGARERANTLQADLAPHFDLAGYFA